MKLAIILALVIAAPLGAQKKTAADSADYRCVMAKFDTLKVANGYGQKRQLATSGQACATRGFTRDDSVPLPPPVNRPPVAAFTYPAIGCKAKEPCAFDASASTDDKGIVSYQWNCPNGAPLCTTTGVTVTTIYASGGTYPVTLTVRDAEGLTSSVARSIPVADAYIPPVDTVTPPPDSILTFANPPTLPQSTPEFTILAPTRSYRIGTNLQAALDTAKSGDELRLSGTYTGNFVLPKCTASGWIILTTASIALPPAGTRVTPADAPNLPRIQTTNTEPAISTVPGACNYVLRGLDVYGALENPAVTSYGIVKLGGGGDEGQTTLASVPKDFVIERSWIHGAPGHNDTRCIVLNSANTIIRDSWISNCHAKGSDSQAIEGWNGPGPYLIENNFVGGAGENIMFGGADPGIQGLSPSDITIRRNHVAKDTTWRGKWTVKNLFELKNARRVLVESNVFENNWVDGQSGMAIVIKSSQDACGTCTWQGTTDLTFRWNIVRNSPRGFNLQAVDCSGQACVDVHVQRVRAENNLFQNIGAEGDAWLNLLTNDLTDIALVNNTYLHAPNVGTSRGAAIMMDYGYRSARRIEIRNNIFTSGAYEVFHSGGNIGSAALDSLAGPSWIFKGNAIVGGQYGSKYPQGNAFPGTVPLTPGVDQTELSKRTAGVVVTSPVAARAAARK